MNAVNCFKDVAATATFGKFGMATTIGKYKRWIILLRDIKEENLMSIGIFIAYFIHHL